MYRTARGSGTSCGQSWAAEVTIARGSVPPESPAADARGPEPTMPSCRKVATHPYAYRRTTAQRHRIAGPRCPFRRPLPIEPMSSDRCSAAAPALLGPRPKRTTEGPLRAQRGALFARIAALQFPPTFGMAMHTSRAAHLLRVTGNAAARDHEQIDATPRTRIAGMRHNCGACCKARTNRRPGKHNERGWTHERERSLGHGREDDDRG